MVFALLIAADFYGAKANFEVLFSAHPTFTEFKCKVEAVLATESSLRRPREIPTEPFTVQRMQIYDDKVDLWVDLVSAAQLRPGMQVYVFRRETTFHREVQSKIPPPCKSIPITAAPAAAASPQPHTESPRRLHAGLPVAPSPTVITTPDAHYLDMLARASAVPLHLAVSPHVPLTLPVADVAPPAFPGVLPGVLDAVAASPAPVVGSPQAVVPPPAVVAAPVDPSFAEKVQYVFAGMGRASALRQVSRESFHDYLAGARIHFSADTVGELFAKADCNKDGVLSSAEFTRFAELYPTLLDSLFYRGREEEAMQRREAGVAATNQVLTQLEEQLVRVRRDLHLAGSKVNDHEERVAQSMRSLEAAEDEEQQTKAALDAAQQDAHESRKEVGVRAQEASLVKEEVQKSELALAEAARGVDHCGGKLVAQREVRMKSERRIEELKELIRREEAEAERQREIERGLEGALVTAQAERDNRQVDMDSRVDHLQNKADQLREAERHLAEMQDRQRERGVTHLQARDAVLHATSKKCAEERESVNAKDVEAKHKIHEAEMEKEVQAQREAVVAQETEVSDARAARADAERGEEPILDEEVRLRFQRDTLEQEEAALRDQHRSYHTTHGRLGSAAPTHRSPLRAHSPYA
eukprot:TRINITY_DN6177_c0_g5_i1.p1 TRINITY_DN6177_c0_g5~~TRINITY_DN6177_c0_g5_i1.p1  ORF type:complete len:641 (+),score=286.87 TRINITY_DN6177_c0_g5_i1:71-1993(+)